MQKTMIALLAMAMSASAPAQLAERNVPAPFRNAAPGAVPPALVGSVAAVESDAAAWDALSGAEPVGSFIRMEGVPIGPDRLVTMVLRRIDPFTADARIVVASRGPKGQVTERDLPRPDAQYWVGTIDGEPGSAAAIAHGPAGTLGWARGSWGTAILSSPRAGRTGPVASFVIGDLPEGTIDWEQWVCSAEDGPGVPQPEGGVAGSEPCRQVRIAVETDVELRNKFIGAPDADAATAAYVGTLFAGVQQIYQSGIQALPHVSYLRLWETEDPWEAPGTADQLYQFRDYWNAQMGGVPRDLAAMLSGRGLGGGIAWLSVVCNNSYGYSVSANLAGSFPYPLIDNDARNWDIMVTAHEIGHNFGAPHTHNYCPEPADSCAPSGYFGACQVEQACTAQGTVMSYCHLCSGGLANVQLNFHPLNVTSMKDHLANNGCDLTAGATGAVSVSESLTVFGGSSSTLDILANDVSANCENITLEALPTSSARGVALVRLAGSGPGGRDMVGYAAPIGFSGTDTFTYRVREASGSLSAEATATIVALPLRVPENPLGDVAGIGVAYYSLSAPSVLPDFSVLSPYLTASTSTVNFASTNGNFATSGRADNVGAVWTGWVRIDEPGTYTFSVESDDGSRLFIGDTMLVDNDGLHGMVDRSGTIALAPGKHAIRIEFFEAGGGAGCIARLEGPGIPRAPIEAGRLTRGGVVNRYDLDRDGAVNGADLGLLLGAWGLGGVPADFNDDGTVNGADLGLLIGAWTG